MDAQYEPHWSNYLKQFDLPPSSFQHVPNNSSKMCVIVEPRKHPLLILVIKNFLYMLKDWGMIIYHGTENESYVKEGLKGIPNIKFINMNKANLTVHEYSNMFCSSHFWSHLDYEGCKHALIFQTDTVLLRNDIDRFLKYDYVGAPWRTHWLGILKVGNGGLSLRNVNTMLKITLECPRKGLQNEDIYFAYWCIDQKHSIPTKEEANEFSVETIYYDSPCGLHKPHLEFFPSKEAYVQLLNKRIVV